MAKCVFPGGPKAGYNGDVGTPAIANHKLTVSSSKVTSNWSNTTKSSNIAVKDQAGQ